jgi:glycerophosphoryl diester phosphodiesterase
LRRQRLVTALVLGTFAAVSGVLTVNGAPVGPQASASALPPAAAEPARPAPVAAALAVRVPQPRQPRPAPLVVAHRGASAYRAEHTLDAYRTAAEMGADYVEADLVATRDGALVARHENELSATTDVARRPEFADRRRTQRVEGAPVTGWFTEDFTLAELRTLRALERPNRRRAAAVSTATVPTLQEVVALAAQAGAARGRPVGLYLELKSPRHFAALGLPLEGRVAQALRDAGLAGPGALVFVESFDGESLRTLHGLVNVPLVQLYWTDPGPAALRQAAGYAAAVAFERAALRGGGGQLVRRAQRLGLEVHAYTFANSTVVRPAAPAYRPGDPPALADALAEYRWCYALGVDAVFTDNPDVALQARG